ncbi:MAG TPA: MMPL family transporter, partial [Ktedonobacteraceae bacterium]|nr:MMPL family transporter [Ktedonobacteraceae bacterium]
IITSAAIIVIVVSSCFATADMILVKALGLGMALAVLIDATLVRGLLVPATMRLLGKWNWWLPFVGVQRHLPALAEYLESPNSAKDHPSETAISVVENVRDPMLKSRGLRNG